MEVSSRATADSDRIAAVNPTDGVGESPLGSAAHRQRAMAEARTASLTAHRSEVSSEVAAGASPRGPALVDVPEKSCASDRGMRLLRDRDEYLPALVRIGGDRTSQP